MKKGGNQYLADPRQALFLEHYLNPTSPTFSNALQSALKAGYTQEYSENLTGQMPDWLSEKLGDLQLLSIAENNLRELLQQGEDIKVKADITKFVAETIGKSKYSKRKELTGAEGTALIPDSMTKKKADEAINQFLTSNGQNTADTKG